MFVFIFYFWNFMKSCLLFRKTETYPWIKYRKWLLTILYIVTYAFALFDTWHVQNILLQLPMFVRLSKLYSNNKYLLGVLHIYTVMAFFHLCNLFLLINQNLVFPLQFSTYSRLINTAYATHCDIFSFFPLILPFLITFFRRDDHFWFTQEGLHHICRLASILKL